MTVACNSLLVVDDSEVNRAVLARTLKRQGFRVVAAADGQEALELIAHNEFALVLLDVEMPGLDGFEVLQRVRQSRSANELPIIMVTGRQLSEDVVKGLSCGANDYVTKPIDFPVAIARIRTQLARRKAETALQESEERYALAVRGANDGLWDWNLRTNEVYFSPRWKQMLGLREHGLGDTPDLWFSRVHPEDVDRLTAAVAAHLEDLTPQLENQHRVLHADGAYRWMLARGVAVRDGARKAYRMAGSQTDLTEGKVSDPLTGLPNRILFLDRLGRSIERSQRHDESCAVLVLDLDRFKLVNESLGHQVGDRLLVAIANRLESAARTADTVARVRAEPTVARLGGDEFAVLLEDVRHVSDVILAAERVQQLLGQPFELDGQELFTSASIGIATSETGYQEPQHVLRDAGIAMNRAKALGGARCAVFDDGMHKQAVVRLALETDLRRAVERREFELQYQPILSLKTGTLVGFETLLRWRHPVRGLVGPSQFVDVAEETGLIVPIGSWVLREACRQMRAWLSEAPSAPALTIHVNLSGKQFIQPDLGAGIAAILDDTGLPPSSLNLEITETVLIGSHDSAVATLEQLRSIGVRIAIDDFGTGYSSLSYLDRFPISSLKIDRSFISKMALGNSGIVQAIIGLAEALRLSVIAEGVETSAQLAQLTQLGCEYGQGYLFAPALDADRVGRVLSASMDERGNSRPLPWVPRDETPGEPVRPLQ